MKRIIKYIPYFFYILGFVSFIIPSISLKVDDNKMYYNFLQLTFGKDVYSLSVGLFLVFLLFIITVILSIFILYKDNKIISNITIILGLASGVLSFFQRMLSNPSSTDCSINVGLILPGIFILLGTIFLFLDKKIINEDA